MTGRGRNRRGSFSTDVSYTCVDTPLLAEPAPLAALSIRTDPFGNDCIRSAQLVLVGTIIDAGFPPSGLCVRGCGLPLLLRTQETIDALVPAYVSPLGGWTVPLLS